jgi:hypothetical protein
MSNNFKTVKYKENKSTIIYDGKINNFINQIKNKFQINMIEKYIVHLEGFKNIEIDYKYINNLEDLLKAPFFKYLEVITVENDKTLINGLKNEIQKLIAKNKALEFEIKNLKNEIDVIKNEYEKFKITHNEEIKKIYNAIEDNLNTFKFYSNNLNNNNNYNNNYNKASEYNNLSFTNTYEQSNSAFIRCEFNYIDILSVSLKDIESQNIPFLKCQTRFKNTGQVNFKNIKIFSIKQTNEPFYINEINLNDGNEIETNQVIKFDITIYFNENFKFKAGNYFLNLYVKNENGEIEATNKIMKISVFK